MRTRYLILSSATLMLAASGLAMAQTGTYPSREIAPSVEHAKKLKADSTKAYNPTERNPTFRNQAQEQPEPSAPNRPLKMKDTGKVSNRMPVSMKYGSRHVD